MKEVLLGIDLGGTNIKISVFDRTFVKLGGVPMRHRRIGGLAGRIGAD